MAQLTKEVLKELSNQADGVIDSLELAKRLKEDHQKIIGAIKSLQSSGNIIEVEQLTYPKVELTAEGKSFVENGSHEAIVFNAVAKGKDGTPQPEIVKVVGVAAKIGVSKAIGNGWLKIQKQDNVPRLVRVVDSIEDKVRTTLAAVQEGSTPETNVLADLKKRKLLTQVPVNYYKIRKGADFTLEVVKLETELTPEMIATGSWRGKQFKSYNFKALGTNPAAGHLHPLMKVRAEFRTILLELGFSEMPTNRFVESSFWNFDALFVPQKHPARDAQDTFFMSQPETCNSIPAELMLNVQGAHTGQAYDTEGYGPVWKEGEARKNVLRTHTTAASARMLYRLGSQENFKPAKLFSIDRVFRNETLDATHLAEFHQVEGVVADYNLNLGNLIGIMKEFFSRLGIDQLRFKPAYNPYTEPSMEVFSYHDGLKKWVEVGNSGMFRPEMLLPLGLPKGVRVIAWGLSLERPTMIRYGIDNIRDLVGHKVDLQMVYNNPLCRLDKNPSDCLVNTANPEKHMLDWLNSLSNVQPAPALMTVAVQTDETSISLKKKKKKKKRKEEKQVRFTLPEENTAQDANANQAEANQPAEPEEPQPCCSKSVAPATPAANEPTPGPSRKPLPPFPPIRDNHLHYYQSVILNKPVIQEKEAVGPALAARPDSNSSEGPKKKKKKRKDKDREEKEPEVKDPKLKEPEVKDSKVKEPEVKDLNVKDPKVKEPEVKDPKVKDPKVKDPKVKDPKVKDPKVKDPKVKDIKVKEPEVKESDVKERKVMEPKTNEPEVKVEQRKEVGNQVKANEASNTRGQITLDEVVEAVKEYSDQGKGKGKDTKKVKK